MQAIKLSPCPFCGGPPVPTVQRELPPFGKVERQAEYGDLSLPVEAYVFCHECGAQGPHQQEFLDDAQDYDDVLLVAVQLWQQRDTRHRDLYDGGEAEGVNLFPRSDEACKPSN